MNFNESLSEDVKEILEAEYEEYVKKIPMTPNERRALREWVKAGNSVYDNPEGAWHDGGVPVEFLDTFRDAEYIREHIKGMSDEETHRFAMAYYGWDVEDGSDRSLLLSVDEIEIDGDKSI